MDSDECLNESAVQNGVERKLSLKPRSEDKKGTRAAYIEILAGLYIPKARLTFLGMKCCS